MHQPPRGTLLGLEDSLHTASPSFLVCINITWQNCLHLSLSQGMWLSVRFMSLALSSLS